MKALARNLGIGRHTATGLMNDLWEWTGDYATDGAIGRHTNEDIADGIEYDGDANALIDALVQAGWVDACDEHRVCIHDWAEQCDEWVKKRIARSKTPFAHPVETPSDDVSTPSVNHGGQRQPCKERKGKEREGKEGGCKGGDSHNGRMTNSQAESIYGAYPRKVGKQAAIKAIRSAHAALVASGHDDPVGYLFRQAMAYAASPSGKKPLGDDPDYRPHPATWFNQGRYDDDPDEWQKPNGDVVRGADGLPITDYERKHHRPPPAAEPDEAYMAALAVYSAREEEEYPGIKDKSWMPKPLPNAPPLTPDQLARVAK
ncbi:MAG: hypothetical protein Q8R92_18515 [Deltaproteobacteria bacterium]|nr:hypothetical protein [Deltaproteobacteria bacterium]